ncbi:hypothetical protein Pcinc_043010 [Petrolisthes cinctipes]|uniref:Regulatory protein zeste n=1 Tax=Petrolisthes cinctipes TaxID=88211 RepID=A0AAE1EGH0_PETCI|nr:hypothetical protein Pcinc_043010 [Petrolisthes cinctipes]
MEVTSGSRVSPMGAMERDLLKVLVGKEKVIHVKRSDRRYVIAKQAAWQRVTHKYNSHGFGPRRTLRQLKKAYERIKIRAKHDKVRDTMKTGDDSATPDLPDDPCSVFDLATAELQDDSDRNTNLDVTPGCSGEQDEEVCFLSQTSARTSGGGDVGGFSSYTDSAAQNEKPLTDTDTDSLTDTDSFSMLLDSDWVRKGKRRQRRVSSKTAHTIVDIQRNLHSSVDRLEQYMSAISKVDQHMGGINIAIKELVTITQRLESTLGYVIQSTHHEGRDNSTTNSHKSQPSMPPHNHLSTHSDDDIYNLPETAVSTRDGDRVQGVNTLPAGVTQQEASQNTSTKLTTSHDDDDDEDEEEEEEQLFGQYIGAAMRKLTDRSRSMAKLKIQQVLFSLQEADRDQGHK